MSNPDYTNKNALATLSCKKPGKTGKKPDCTCDPCVARREIFEHNVGIVEQENRRMSTTTTLKQWAPKP